MNIRAVNRAVLALGGLLAFVLLPSIGHTMPNFARKYDKNCSMCHTQVPKLNRTGFEFRLAGYRTPDEIGEKEADFDLADFFAARIQMQNDYKKHDDVNPTKNTSSDQLTFFEATLYPLTGSWGQHFGSLVELSMAPGEGFEVENAYVRGVWGDQNGFFTGKIGVMHPQEGFGASDRVLGNVRPLFQKQPANPGSPFYLWNVDEMAVEAGYYWVKSGTNISGRISNGVIWKADSNGTIGDHADPAQGGALTKTLSQPASNHKNWQAVLNQYLSKDSGFTVYYYQGVIPYPDTSANVAPYTEDKFSRLAVYANWYALPKTLNLQAGWEDGKDTLDDPNINLAGGLSGTGATQNSTKVGKSGGYFAGVEWYPIDGKLAFGARYDNFDPSKKVDHNTQKAWSLSANYHPIDYVQVVADFVHKSTEAGASAGENKDEQLLIRLICIF